MKQIHESLQKLLAAARRTPQADPGPLPQALETRVLARWRSGPVRDEAVPLAVLFRQALVCAGLVMLLSIGWNYLESRGEAAGTLAVAHYEMTVEMLP